MTIKRNNRFFLYFIVILAVGQAASPKALSRFGLYMLVPYLLCLGLGLLLLKKDNTPFSEALPYKKTDCVTILISVALTFALIPLSTALAELGAKIGGDVSPVFAQVLNKEDVSFAESFFTFAVIPAVFEEMFFRGFVYAGFRRARGPRAAILLSALLFGLFHMNIQQFLYAAVMGVFLGVLREVTGSVWPSTILHFVNNGWSCVLDTSAENSILRQFPLSRVTFRSAGGETVHAAAMTFICTCIAVCLLLVLARRAKRFEETLQFFPHREGEKGKLFTGALIIALVLLILVTLFLSFVLTNMSAEAINSLQG